MIKFMEKMWLMTGIITAALAIYKVFATTTRDAAFFLLFSGVSFLLYFLRRKQRMNMEKNQD